MDSPYLRIPQINTRNTKDKALDSPSILTCFSNTGNKEMNFSTGQMELARVANNQAVAHGSLIGRYFRCASGFIPNQIFKNTRNREMRFHQTPYQTFCPITPPITHQQLKHPKRTKTNKIMIPASFSLVFRTKLTIPELKSQ